MKLSQAIRLGAMLKPKGHGGLLVNGKTCALGAACEAVGITIGRVSCDTKAYAEIQIRWPLLGMPANHELIPEGGATVMEAIWMLNDRQGLTREQIADWVETIEEGTDVATVLHSTSESRA